MNSSRQGQPVIHETFSSAMSEAHAYNLWIINYYRNFIKESVLEIGVGHGAFYGYLPSYVHQYMGVDIDPALVENARNVNPQHEYIVADLMDSSFNAKIKNQKFQTILCLNVLEHIQDDRLALHNMIDALEPNGALLLFVPAFQNLYNDMDAFAGHHRRYHIKMMRDLLKGANGTLSEWCYFNPIGGMGWWVNKFFKHKTLNDDAINAQIRFFNRFILPLSKIVQPLTKRFFGQSLYCVIKKNC